jgi:hypothetical protein
MNRMIPTLALAAMTLAACDQKMDVQPGYREYSQAPSFRGGALRNPPAGAVVRDDLIIRMGEDVQAASNGVAA